MAPSPDRFTIDLTGVTLMGHFRVEGKMAAGGMGSVWKAVNLSLKKPVAVKVPDQALLGREGFRARFQLEIEQLVKFNHPNVVSILAAGEHEGVPFFVLDYLEGGSLKDRLVGAGGREAPNEVLSWLKPIAAALDVLHANDVIHRDVKPGNILFHKFGQPYLSDFGIAKVLSGGAASLTTTGGALFTAAYAAPEQMADDVGGASISGAADQYALASTVYEALGGRPPFEGSTSQIIAGKLTREPPDLRALAAHVPAAACAAVAKALSRRAQDRFRTCAAFAAAFEAGLGAVAGGAPTVHRTRRAAAQAPVKASEPQPRSRALPLLALLALLGGGGFFGLKALGVVGGAKEGASTERANGPAAPPTPSPAAPSGQPQAPFAADIKRLNVILSASNAPKALVDLFRKAIETRDAAVAQSAIEAGAQAGLARAQLQALQDLFQTDGTSPSATEPTPPALIPGHPSLPEWAEVSPEQIGEAKRLGVEVAFDEPTTGMRFVLIPGGTFQMGSPEAEDGGLSDERLQHRVTVPAFYLSIHETTNAQYRRFKSDHKGGFEGDTRPVETVSHEEATAFAAWLSQQGSGAAKGGYRLPSEAEWEYACRAGTTTRFWSGDSEADLARGGWYDANAGSTTHPVGEKPANPWGLHDMHGNVWECCADDYHSSYTGAPSDGSAWIDSPRAEYRVYRGGCWGHAVQYLRSAVRLWFEPSLRYGFLGFRLARAVTAR